MAAISAGRAPREVFAAEPSAALHTTVSVERQGGGPVHGVAAVGPVDGDDSDLAVAGYGDAHGILPWPGQAAAGRGGNC